MSINHIQIKTKQSNALSPIPEINKIPISTHNELVIETSKTFASKQSHTAAQLNLFLSQNRTDLFSITRLINHIFLHRFVENSSIHRAKFS